MFKRTLVTFVALCSLSAVAPAALAAGETHVMLTTSAGNIELALDSQKAPVSTQNFVDYVNSGYYNNTIFHRVIPGFMIQGGGFEPGMNQKATNATIKNEANNGLKNTIGTLAMARTNDPHSATAQFFINVADNDFLNFRGENVQGWGYCVFAEVVEGMDVVNKIKGVKTGRSGMHQDVPVEDVVINSVTVSE
ncbi:peptidylprolyl isomerase [Serratia marcescens]|uniref:peptidylprolyl isomerase n=1 Tax=Serratia marcescens TaxID=615 RepID=UPI0013DFE9FD